MTDTGYRFPFGESVTLVEQADRSPKRVFVLGVYASAVHARWTGPDGAQRVGALAVASEPEIFWRGDGAGGIIERIPVPAEAGKLVPAAGAMNGPSAKALDELILAPLGFGRKDAWLCDVVPHSCWNDDQREAAETHYVPVAEELGLPVPDMPPKPTSQPSDERVGEILAELQQSEAGTVVLLGDLPIKWFASRLGVPQKSLASFGTAPEEYGRRHAVDFGGHACEIVPLVHPRQAAGLGAHSAEWRDLHQEWVRRKGRE